MAEPKVLVIVLAGGEGRRLAPLTSDRAKPAVPFGGSYRIIDFVLSNFANARYLQIVVLTQYKSHSLDRHISQTWRFSTLLGNYVTPVPAQMRRGPQWFSGSADAIYQNLNLISDEKPDLVCVFGADHIYHMDPRQMVEHHSASGAGVTVAAIPVPDRRSPLVRDHRSRTRQQDRQVPREATGSATDARRPDPRPGLDGQLRVLHRRRSIDIVTPKDDAGPKDIGGDVIPALTSAGVAHLYDFSTNVIPGPGRARARLLARRRLARRLLRGQHGPAGGGAELQPLQPQWPVYSLQLPLPPAKLAYGIDRAAGPGVDNTLMSSGSIVSGGLVDGSVLEPRGVRRRRRRGVRVDPVPRREGRARGQGAPLRHRQERRGAARLLGSATTSSSTASGDSRSRSGASS